MCNCSKRGFRHWWKYLKLRYYWRNFWASLRYQRRVIDGKDRWVDRTSTLVWTGLGVFFVPVERMYNQYPGPCMRPDEYEHWFPRSV
ncbi:hypothetical protein ES703_35068 [subsurface metagenome]